MRPKPDFLPRMRGATGSVAGRRGLVPKPAAADNVKYLKGDGSWSALSNASAATDAEAAAGTSSTTFVTPANAALAAAKVINPRAPRQALVFDGTFPATGTLSAFGANGYSIAVQFNLPSLATDHGLFDGSGLLFIVVRSTGRIDIYDRVASAYLLQTAAGIITAGKTYNLQVVRGSAYLNGIALGTYADNSTYTGTSYKLGSDFISGTLAKGTIGLIGICNRTLSAAEVLALYEQGAPAAADYNNASNTAAVNSDFSSGTSWSLGGGASIGSGKLTIPSAGTAYNSTHPILKGKKVRFTVTVDSISAGNVMYYDGSGYNVLTAVAGTFTVEFTPLSNYSGISLNANGGTCVFDNFMSYNLGLLCAPEATAPGNGYQWKDMSGNMADITLPGSGVSWVLPDTRPNSVRERLTWAGTHERKYLLGSERAFPSGSLLTDVTTKASVGSSGSGLSIGTFNDGSRWVAANAFTTAKKVHALVNRMPASDSGVDHNLNIDPDNANYTGSIDVEVRYVVTKGTQ